MSSIKKIALIGNPNSGKTSLFNALTGLNQSVGNYPGVTVDKKYGKYTHAGIQFEIVDLPGVYSANPKSEDEKVAIEFLDPDNKDNNIDLVLYVADASNLKRSLLLCTQLIDKKIPVVVGLNMLDVAEENGFLFDENQLTKKFGIPFIRLNSRTKEGIEKLKNTLIETLSASAFLSNSFEKYTSSVLQRFEKISEILVSCTQKIEKKNSITQLIDKYTLHPVFGYAIFLSILTLMFQSIFSWSAYPTEWIEYGFGALTELLSTILPDHFLTSLLLDGVLAGLAGIVVFVPQIAFLFFFIAILEDTGYMTRVSFILDKLMRKIGLNGRSVIPLMGGVACAIPAIMSARTISNKKERLLTIMVTPLMTCSARIPVYILIISIIIPSETIAGIFSLQGLALTGLYFIGIIVTILASLVFNQFIKTNERSSFIMDMPVYRMPRWSNIGYTILEKVKVFLVDAGKIIVAISIILWGLSSYGPTDRFDELQTSFEQGKIDNTEYNSLKLENSYAGMMGKTLEPIIEPLGFNWKMGIALVTSFAAREVFVATMATIYSVEDKENTTSIREKMMNEIKPNGEKVYTFAVGFSLLLFYAFAMQCMSTLAVVFRETKSWKWPAIQLVYMTGIAYLFSFIAYQLLR
ncbi:MAG: ferrous iron transport protein B [Flavobacteriales bacterium]|nr:ferrous iron transport protein B [Flavobacteriales bacterium]